MILNIKFKKTKKKKKKKTSINLIKNEINKKMLF